MNRADGQVLDEALRAVGVRNLVLALHDASFPSAPDEDSGRGSPYGPGARAFLDFARSLGFNGVQLGPQGETSADNPSPYDGTVFARGVLSISLADLVTNPRWSGVLDAEDLATLVRQRPGDDRNVPYVWARRAHREVLGRAWQRLRARRERARASRSTGGEAGIATLAEALERFRREQRAWLQRDAIFEVLAGMHATEDWRTWSASGATLDQRLFAPHPGEEAAARARLDQIERLHADEIERFAFMQLVLDEQHRGLRTETRSLGLRLFGDLQVGYAHRDRWSYRALFLGGYVMGAPPSRTNPEGQPWGYPVLDPDLYRAANGDTADAADAGAGGGAAAGPVLRMVAARMARMLADFDGVRIDHPHGLVCPWVYRVAGDPGAAVKEGARLFSSPDLPDHPDLARWAIARREQLADEPSLRRWADRWVRSLEAEQVERYGVLFAEVVRACRNAGRAVDDLVAEVLSTCPYPLLRVLQRYGLGRFRVTQKASLDDPGDVYRPENAAPEDWVMLGNHDTSPIWLVVEQWRARGELGARAADVAQRLAPDAPEAFARELCEDPGRLAQAMLADLFASRARNVQVFFADLLGIAEVFNRPGVPDPENWTLRVPASYRALYAERLAQSRALDVAGALALAIRARGGADAHRGLVERLEERSRALLGGAL